LGLLLPEYGVPAAERLLEGRHEVSLFDRKDLWEPKLRDDADERGILERHLCGKRRGERVCTSAHEDRIDAKPADVKYSVKYRLTYCKVIAYRQVNSHLPAFVSLTCSGRESGASGDADRFARSRRSRDRVRMGVDS